MQRKLTVSYLPGHFDHIPYLRLQGRWLNTVGFPVGCHITVTVNNRELILTPEEENHDPNPARTMHPTTPKDSIPSRTSTGPSHIGRPLGGPDSQLPEHRAEAKEPKSPNEKDQ